MTHSTIQLIGTTLFGLAIIHTFSVQRFERMAHMYPAHAGLWRLLGEVEVAFGFWGVVLVMIMLAIEGPATTTGYIDSRSFTEPMFVFAIIVIAGTRPVLQTAMTAVRLAARALPLPGSLGTYPVVLILVPLLGSLITEPAAMTLAALILVDRFFSRAISTRLKYATLGVLLVNISIGGTLTSYAAPPVLMVAHQWGWGSWFMLSKFGWKAGTAIAVNAAGATFAFRKELRSLPVTDVRKDAIPVPLTLVIVHLALLTTIVVFAEQPKIFMGLFVIFLGVANAYPRHQDRLILREAALVGFFLAGLVVLGGQQQWWVQPVLQRISHDAVFFGATVLTSVIDNAALTYLGSLVQGLSDNFRYALVAGAVTGGGLTIIANAPNPAGIAILGPYFEDGVVRPITLLLAALPPTIIAACAFVWL